MENCRRKEIWVFLVYVLGFGGVDLQFLELATMLHVQAMLCYFCSLVHCMKDGLRHKTALIYSIPCKCGWICIGWTRSSQGRIERAPVLHVPCTTSQPAVAECSNNRVHHIELRDCEVLSTKVWKKAWIIIEVINLELHMKNMNRKDGQVLSTSWTFHVVWLNEQQGNLSKGMRNRLSFILTFTGDASSLVSSLFFILCCHSFIPLSLCPINSRPDCTKPAIYPSYWLTKLGSWRGNR